MSDDLNLDIPIQVIEKTEKESKSNNQHAARMHEEMQHTQIEELLQQVTDDINDINSIKQILPDVNHVKQLRVSTILSPKDMLDPDLNIGVDPEIFDGKIDTDIIDSLIKHFKTHVKFEENMSLIAGEALMDKGSFIYLITPPTEVDVLVTEGAILTHEDFNKYTTLKEYGIVDSNNDFLHNLDVELVDDPTALHIGSVKSLMDEEALAEITHEAYGSFRRNEAKTISLSVLHEKLANKRKDAHPLLSRVPSDCCFPMTEYGDETKHVEYVFALDEHGNFLSNVVEEDYMAQLESRLARAFEDKGNNLYQIVQDNNFKDHNNGESKDKIKQFWRSYQNRLFEELTTSIKNGKKGSKIKVSRYESLYKTILARKLANLKTRLLVVPADYVAYFAFNYNSLGIGESLIQKTKFLANLRAVMMLARIKGAVANAIPSQLYEIMLDEKEKDPLGVLQMVSHSISKYDINSLPTGTYNPNNILSSLGKAGIRFKINGGNVMPGTTIDHTDTSRNVTLPDDTIDEELKKLHYLGMGTTPEMIDQTLQGDFATGILTNYMLYTKACMRDQSTFINDSNDFFAKYIRLDPVLYNKIKKVYRNKTEQFIDSLTLKLPSADMTVLERQAEGYRIYSDMVDEAIESYYTDEMVEGMMAGDYHPNAARGLRAAIAAKLKRDYMLRENMFPEIFKSLTDEDGQKRFSDELISYHKDLIKMSEPIIAELIKGYQKSEKWIEDKVNTPTPAEAGVGGDTPPLEEEEPATPEEEPATPEEEPAAPEEEPATPEEEEPEEEEPEEDPFA